MRTREEIQGKIIEFTRGTYTAEGTMYYILRAKADILKWVLKRSDNKQDKRRVK